MNFSSKNFVEKMSLAKSKEVDKDVERGSSNLPESIRKKSSKVSGNRQSITAERASSKSRTSSKESIRNSVSKSRSTPRASTVPSLSSRARSHSPRVPTKTAVSPRKASITSKTTTDDEFSMEINAWLQRMKLSKVIRNPKQDFSNGYLVAEIFHYHFGPGGIGEVSAAKFKKHLPPLTRFLKTSNRQAKLDNWSMLQKASKKLGLKAFPSQSDIDGIIMGKKGVAVKMVRMLYEQIGVDKINGEADMSASISSIDASSVVAPSSMVMNIETVPEHTVELGGQGRDDDTISSEVVQVVEVGVPNSEEMDALKWADREAEKAMKEADEEHRHVVFAGRSTSEELDEDHINRRMSLMGELQGSVGRGGVPNLRKTLSNRETKAEQNKLKEEQERVERRKRRLLRGGSSVIDLDSDCDSAEEEEREAMDLELRKLLGGSVLQVGEEAVGSAFHGSRIAIAADVQKGSILGRGRFACVFAGVWAPELKLGTESDEPVSKQSEETDVAVKEFMFGTSRKTAPLAVQRVFHREALTLATLAHHPKVMDLVGVVLVPRPMILLELLNVGSLFDVMHGEAMRGKWQTVSMREKLGLCVDISEGLAHLHAANLLHGDLKSHNVLVGLRQGRGEHAGVSLLQAKLKRQLEGWGDADGSLPAREEGLVWIAKLGDLGTVAKIPAPHEPPLSLEVGTSGWMAPEVCWSVPTGNEETKGYGLSADVWSFGVVLWECFGDHHRIDPFKPGTGLWRGDSNPFAGIAAEEYLRRLQEGERWPLTLTDDDDEVTIDTLITSFEQNGDFLGSNTHWGTPHVNALQEVAISCWNFEPSKRPLVSRICHNMHSIADSLVS